jgi:transcriptional regulator with XRE-family HTH domain
MIDVIDKIATKDIKTLNGEDAIEIVKWIRENLQDVEKISLLLRKSPQTILIFRLLTNLTRQSFSRKLNISFDSLKKAENGEKIRIETAINWGEKVSRFLQSQPIDWNFEKFKKIWEEKKKKNFEDFNSQIFNRLRDEFLKLNLPNDLRRCNNEEFIRAFKWLKEKIDEVGICEELLKVEPQLLLILRMSLGLSQKEFAKKIGKTFRWVRDIDSKRRFLEDPQTIGRVLEGLSKLSLGMKEDIALATWSRFKIAAHESMREFEKKSLVEFKKEDIEELFEKVRNETNDFTSVPLELLINRPSSLLIFRLGMGMGIKKFSLLIGINERWLRKIESSQGGMSLGNAIRMKEILENLLKDKKIDKETVVRNFIKFKNFIASSVNNLTGIKLAEKAPLTNDEKIVMDTLQKMGIEFQIHSTLQLHTGKFVNVDFTIRKDETIFVIEVFSLSKMGRIATLKISEIDHRFRGLKMNNPNIKTIMIISSKEKELSKIIAEKAKMETFDTDFILTIDEVEKIASLVT